MKYKEKGLVISLIVIACLCLIGILFLLFSPKIKEHENKPDKPKINIDAIIFQIKEENSSLSLEYETTNIQGIKSLVYKDNSAFKSIIIDTNTGKIINFNDLIKPNYQTKFQEKEEELLKLKYPKFIITQLNFIILKIMKLLSIIMI